jgi:CHAT domain-containing protein
LTPGHSETRFLDLGPAGRIDQLIDDWRKQFAMEARAPGRSGKVMEEAARKAGTLLRARLWDPLAQAVSGAESIFLVPEGPVHLVNFGALPSAQSGRYLMETAPLLHYLNTELDLAMDSSNSEEKTLLVVGDPDFEGTQRSSRLTAGRRLRGEIANCFDPTTLRFDPLPLSRVEAGKVLKMWSASGRKGTMISGADATEEAVRSAAPGYRILHLATHGFFYPSHCGIAKPDVSPVAIAGLALASANRRPNGPGSGLLTADEISSLPLDQTEWVVLSGCDTGLGAIQAGEGVFGLRRAFQQAGARTVIMSLWPVQDESAHRWMDALYRDRLYKRTSTASAVRAASLAVLTRQRREGRSTHPFYWAPFVAAGDWR